MIHRPKIPVAIIGGGSIAPHHAKYVQSSPSCTLVAIIDPFPPGHDLATKLGVSHFHSVNELVAKTDASTQPEIYIVCVPSALHAQVATTILETATAAKVLLVEKPFTTNSDAGRAVVELARKRGCAVVVGHHRRFHAAVVAARETIEAGRIGRVLAVNGMWIAKKDDGYFDVEWRRSRARGGGPVWANLVHDVDLLHFLVGSCVDRVWAVGVPRVRKMEESDGVEEGAAVMLRFANGAVGTFVLCDNVPSPYSWEAATGENPLLSKAPSAVDTFRVFGAKGTLTVPDGKLWTYSQTGNGVDERDVGWNVPIGLQQLDIDDGIPFQSQVEHLVRIAMGEESPRCSGEEGLAVVKVCEAIVDILDSGDECPRDIK